jgi:arginyl-tRNA synthetase
LLYDPKKDFVFDRDASLRFDGESGPYIQYTHARCASILTKLDIVGEHIEYSLLAAEEERVLLVLLSEFPQIVARAATQYQSYLVARYVLDLSKLFNTRYQKHKVITDDVSLSCARGALVAGVKQVLRNGLYLLGIDAPQKM